MTIAQIEKFISPNVSELMNGCWVWRGPSNGYTCKRSTYGGSGGGYGYCWDGEGNVVRVNRAIWEAFNGFIPAGHEIDHTCNDNGCVRVDHLEVVTPAENKRRKYLHRDKIHLTKTGHKYETYNKFRGCKHCANANRRLRRASIKNVDITG